MSENDRENTLAAMRLCVDRDVTLNTREQLALRHANEQCLRTLRGILAEEEGGR